MPSILWGDITLFTLGESYATCYVGKSFEPVGISRIRVEINKKGVTKTYAHFSLGLRRLRVPFVDVGRRVSEGFVGLILWADILPYMSESLMIEKIVSIIILLYKYIHI